MGKLKFKLQLSERAMIRIAFGLIVFSITALTILSFLYATGVLPK